MKYLFSIFCICICFTNCKTTGNCPTTDKNYFYRGIKKSKPLFKGYPANRGYKLPKNKY